MNKKIVGILVCTLLTVTVLPVAGSTYENDSSQISDEVYVDDDCGCGSNSRSGTRFPVNGNPPAPLDPDLASPKPTTWDTPDYFSWKDYEGKDWTTPVKNQGSCGSCWDFGALGGLESAIKIWENNPDLDIDLSEQYLLSCSSGGCDGWYLRSALSWIKHNGMIPEECLPYQADDTIPCESKCPEWREHLIGIKNYKKITTGDITAVQEALIEYGPLPASMEIFEDFYRNYAGGVYKHTYGGLVGYHAVTIVGYDNTWGDEDEGYWICKNSWGADWGENGWFRIAYGECGIENNTYYLEGPNYPPLKPEKPNGPASGKPGVNCTYSTSCIDPDGNKLYYMFDWGDGHDSDWLGPYESGEIITAKYKWESEGTYKVKVKTVDILSVEKDYGIKSEWSEPLVVLIAGNAPRKPDILSGPTSGKAGTEYTYAAATTDPDGDDISYLFDWGDGSNSGWVGPYISGETVEISHIWNEKGNYEIKVKARDIYGDESEWSDSLSVTMPRNKAINKPFLNFLQNHPNLFPVLRQLLKL